MHCKQQEKKNKHTNINCILHHKKNRHRNKREHQWCTSTLSNHKKVITGSKTKIKMRSVASVMVRISLKTEQNSPTKHACTANNGKKEKETSKQWERTNKNKQTFIIRHHQQLGSSSSSMYKQAQQATGKETSEQRGKKKKNKKQTVIRHQPATLHHHHRVEEESSSTPVLTCPLTTIT